jgi:kynurenine formamidase
MMIRKFFPLFALIFTVILQACSPSSLNQILDLSKVQWIDLSHAYDEKTLYWPNNVKGFEHHEEFKGITPGNFFYSSYSISTPEHGGTHLDAPIHFAEKGFTLDQIPLTSLTGYAVVINVSDKTKSNPDYLISPQDLMDWEAKNGQIPAQSIVLFRYCDGSFTPREREYFGTDKKGVEAIPELHFPGIDPATSRWLVEQRNPKAVGIDTASIDYGQSKDFQTHQILLGKIYLVLKT